MNRWQLAEEDEPAKDTGRSPLTREKNPGVHGITENRSGGYFNQREWSTRMNITETSKEQQKRSIANRQIYHHQGHRWPRPRGYLCMSRS